MCKYSSFRLCLYLRHSGNAFEPESRCFLKLCNYLWPTATNFVYRLHRPSPVIESEPPFIELSITANKLKRSVLCAFCVNGGEGTNDRHFDKTCFAFMALTRGNFCLTINLITKCHECSSVVNLSNYFYSFFCGDSSDSAPTYSKKERLPIGSLFYPFFCVCLSASAAILLAERILTNK
jgi:hypothetical protein